jgi:fermentation-respiration switch protein FrsA (DUF1100 family)
LIVESTFTSARELGRQALLIPLYAYVPKSRFDSITKIAQVRAPIMVLHGTRDELIPFAMGEKLFRGAPEPKKFVPVQGAGHNDVLLVGGEHYLRAIKQFVEKLGQATSSSGQSED